MYQFCSIAKFAELPVIVSIQTAPCLEEFETTLGISCDQ